LSFPFGQLFFTFFAFDLSVNKDLGGWGVGGGVAPYVQSTLHEEQEGPNKYHRVTT
jgi:hypothetical protein